MIYDGGGAHSFVVRYGTGWHYFRAGALCSYMLLSLYTRVLSRLLFLVVYIYILRSVFMSWSGAVAILVIFIDLAVHIEYSAQYRPTILIFCEFYLSQREMLVNHWEVDCLSSAAVLHGVQFLRMFRVQTYSFDINRATSMVSNVMSLSVVLRRRTALF